jgi:hypothetical protein
VLCITRSGKNSGHNTTSDISACTLISERPGTPATCDQNRLTLSRARDLTAYSTVGSIELLLPVCMRKAIIKCNMCGNDRLRVYVGRLHKRIAMISRRCKLCMHKATPKINGKTGLDREIDGVYGPSLARLAYKRVKVAGMSTIAHQLHIGRFLLSNMWRHRFDCT